MFNGCARGGLAEYWVHLGELYRDDCENLCDADNACNGIEVNGCLSNPVNCGGDCYLLYGSGDSVYNGECDTTGNQIAYLRREMDLSAVYGYEKTVGLCRGGSNYAGLDTLWNCIVGLDFEDCVLACEADAACVAFDYYAGCCLYGPGNVGDGTVDDRATCYMKCTFTS